MKVNKQFKMAVAACICLAASSIWAKLTPSQLKLDVAVDKPIMLADTKQTAYLRVALTGFDMDCLRERAPVNVAIVIDKSGSMSGGKIAKAKEAAIMAIGRLSYNDIISVVTYDTEVEVLVGATKVSDKERIFRKIRSISAGGSTALYGGVKKGSEELQKFLSGNRVNRLVLLSDGLANVGPQTPEALGELGTSLVKKGISVTTIGLGTGYNEDLMTQLAYTSDGSHYFAENANDLAKIFDSEFDRALSVVAQEIQVKIKCAPGIRSVRLLGRQGSIDGQTVSVFINQLYSEHQKCILLEVEVPTIAQHKTRQLATVDVRYDNLKTHTTDKLSSSVEVKFSNSEAVVEANTNPDVMVDVVELIATERNELAVNLRDKGNIAGAMKVLSENESYLRSNYAEFKSAKGSGKLEEYAEQQKEDSDNLEGQNWGIQRKRMRQVQLSNIQQQ